MIDLSEKLKNIKNWTILDVKNIKIQRNILKKIEIDLQNEDNFTPSFYLDFSEHYSFLGKTYIHLLNI